MTAVPDPVVVYDIDGRVTYLNKAFSRVFGWELNELKGRRVAAFAGIGNPQGFYHSLETLGCDVTARRDYPDHFLYDHEDIVDLQNWIADTAPVDAVVCTCKDLVKIDAVELGNRPLWALAIEVDVVRGLDVLERVLEAVCRKL